MVLIACAFWLGCGRTFYTEALASPFFAFTLAGASVLLFRVCRNWLDVASVALFTFAAAVVDFRVLQFPAHFMAWISFAGLGSLLVLGIRLAWNTSPGGRRLAFAFVPAALLVASEYFAGDLLRLTAHEHPKVLDLYLFSFDSSLHVQLPFLLGQAFAKSYLLREFSLFFYIALSLTIAVVYAGRLVRFGEKALSSFVAFIITGPLGILFYNFFPALGPAHLFRQDFPWHPLTIAQVARLYAEPISLAGPPNAIPSLHMAWVMLAWWYSRGLSVWERAISLAFVVFTIFATLGTGEHYFIDLVVAFPFALLIESICSFSLPVANRQRVMSILVGLFATLVWFMLLRHALHFFWLSPVLPWVLCIGTVVVCMFLESRLYAQTSPALKPTHQRETVPVES